MAASRLLMRRLRELLRLKYDSGLSHRAIAQACALPRWTLQIRPLIDTSKPATTGAAAETSEFYFVASSVRKSVWTLVRQLRGPHFRTWA